jgi:hypothetical protein
VTDEFDTPPEIIKDLWRVIRSDDQLLVRSRLVWKEGVETAIAEEVRVDYQRSDNWHEYTHLRHRYVQSIEREARSRRAKRAASRDLLTNNAQVPVRDARGHFVKA